MTGDPTWERIAKNNAIFREANQKIRAKADQHDAPMERIPFLCECAREDCTQIVRLTLEQYTDVRSHPAHFLTAVGHEGAEEPLGQLVSKGDGYHIIEKAATG
jgi:hypothetical protein